MALCLKIPNRLRKSRLEFKEKNDQTTPSQCFKLHVRMSAKIMDNCFENRVGLVSTAKPGPAGRLETLNDKDKLAGDMQNVR